MTKKLSRVGSSWCLILDKPLMDLLGLKPGCKVSIEVTEAGLTVRAADAVRKTGKRARDGFDGLG